MTKVGINEVDRVEILSLVDNYIELTSGDSTKMISRAIPVKNNELTGTVLAEHGFSVLVKTITGENSRTLIMDFGLSGDIAARNAVALNADLQQVEVAVLSHGHSDHFGGLAEIVRLIGKNPLDLIVHPVAFRKNRYLIPFPGVKVKMPYQDKEGMKAMGLNVIESHAPYSLLGGDVLFLGEIPRNCEFEPAYPNAVYEEDGQSCQDIIEDDSLIVMNLKNKGLVIISGCAHSGIINSVQHAQSITGINKVHAVIGGFHLSGPVFEPRIKDTIEGMKRINPDYVVPTHCTGRKAIVAFEAAMGDKFLLNMSGTKLTFSA